MQIDRRAICGPTLATAIALIAIVLDRRGAALPDPAPLFVCIVALAASLSGLGSGLASAAIAVAASALLLLAHRATGFEGADLVRLAMLALSAIATATITGLLRRKMRAALSWERARHATAARLASALDQIDIGVVLLDADTRAEFINRAFREYFSLPDAKADARPPFIALMYHGRDTGAYELPEEELSEFIARRTELMRVGDSTPIDINLADGRVLRFSCTVLPDGGRMLSYTPVTDLVRHTDEPAQADYYLSLRNSNRALERHLRAAE
ncbi:MAG TPA: PAS-domain containing protein [Bradyrhizobium sp.]|nr:PAS-domain containing protein [Bradyrhizobium sp.]